MLSWEIRGLSRTLDDPQKTAGAEVPRFQGISKVVRVGNGPSSSKVREITEDGALNTQKFSRWPENAASHAHAQKLGSRVVYQGTSARDE
ncbi:MAG: hypothetical protein NVSMB9_10140 [Isosphaeraceae bacterium]